LLKFVFKKPKIGTLINGKCKQLSFGVAASRDLGFVVYGLLFGVWGLALPLRGICDLGFVVYGLLFGVWGLAFGDWGLGFGVAASRDL
jgi:hypothetical protein